jgi:hypothetical protein
MKLLELPEDILINIFMNIDPLKLIDISKTNSQINRIIHNILFKKILIMNTKPISNYDNSNFFFVYIFDSYIYGNKQKLGVPFNENNNTYVLLDMNSQYVSHSSMIKNGKYSFFYTGICVDTNMKSVNIKFNPIILRNFNTNATQSR